MHRTGAITAGLKSLPFLHLTVIGYGIWQSRNLVEAWLHSPFDRWGWLAFMIWVTPVLIGRGSWKAAMVSDPCIRPKNPPLPIPGGELPASQGSISLLGRAKGWVGSSSNPAAPLNSTDMLLLAGLVLAFLGDVGSFNASCNAGLALILLAFTPAHCRGFAMALSSGSWMPALGWFGSQAGLGPTALNAARLGMALLGAAWTLKPNRRRDDCSAAVEFSSAEQRTKICGLDS